MNVEKDQQAKDKERILRPYHVICVFAILIFCNHFVVGCCFYAPWVFFLAFSLFIFLIVCSTLFFSRFLFFCFCCFTYVFIDEGEAIRTNTTK